MHTVQYDDGEVEQLALAFEDWIFAEHLLPGHQQAPGLPLAVPAGGAVAAGLGPSERVRTAASGQRPGLEQGPVAAPRQGAAQMLLGPAATQAEGYPPQLIQHPQQQQPAGVGAPGPLPVAAVPAAVPAAAAGAPAGLASAPHQQQQQPPPPPPPQQAVFPQQLVASGRNYRAFTASALPPGFEIFCLLPGLSIEEVSAAACLCGSG